MKKVTLVKVFTRDQDEAMRFYVQKLGFVVEEDKSMGDYRWLVIRAPDNHELTINLELARTPEQKAIVGKQAADQPLFTLTTDDCHREYNELLGKGVEFEGKPEKMPYGTGVMMKDLYGTKIYVFQEPTG